MTVKRWELDEKYTIDQLADMHEVLDEIDEYRRRYEAKAEADAEARRRKR